LPSGPRVGRGLRRSRVGPEGRFCEAVRNDLRVPLTLEGRPGQCAAFRPGPCDLLPGDRHAWRETPDWPVLAGRGHRGALWRALAACGCGRADLAAARPESSRPSGRGRPPAPESASCPRSPPGIGLVLMQLRAIPRYARASARALFTGSPRLTAGAVQDSPVVRRDLWRHLRAARRVASRSQPPTGARRQGHRPRRSIAR
jgi:hypothetical protein